MSQFDERFTLRGGSADEAVLLLGDQKDAWFKKKITISSFDTVWSGKTQDGTLQDVDEIIKDLGITYSMACTILLNHGYLDLE